MSVPVENRDGSFSEKVTMDALEELDFDEIEDMPWAQELWVNVEDHTKRGFLHWSKIVKSVAGTKDNHIQEWGKLYMQTIDEILCDLVLDVLRMKTSTIDKIQELLKRLQKVCFELHQPMPEKIGEKKLSLYEEQEQLMKHIQKYEVVINAKTQELEKLNEKQRTLCKHLGREPKIVLQYPPLPTPGQLEELQKNIEQLEKERFEREEQYCLLKHNIMEYVNEIKYKPTSDFERKVLSSDNFLVTDENMKKLDFFASCLKDIKKTTEEEISQLRSRIEDLWKMLDVDLIDRDEFRTHYTGNSLETLDALRIEVKRCEEIRKANIKNFVEKLRAEIESLWYKCHCSDLEKRSFKNFYDDCYTEDLLDIHELEIQKWKTYYEKNCRLLGLLEKHQELWEKALELEASVTGPNRYKNRGGKLLQEEKERNKLSKLIPKIEEEIFLLSEEYKKKNGGVSFLSFGRTPEEYIENMHAERENNRKLKLSARKMQRDNTLGHTPAKSALTLFPATSSAVTPTCSSASKRKIFATPNTENVKRLRVNTPRNPNMQPKVTPGTVPKIKVTHSTLPLQRQKRKSRSFTERSRRQKLARKSKSNESRRRVPVVDDCDVTKNTTYSDFQSELSSREKCRSTILPDQLVSITPAASSPKHKRTPAKRQLVKTPSRTPVIPKTPRSRTPGSDSKNTTKLTTCRSNLKLLF